MPSVLISMAVSLAGDGMGKRLNQEVTLSWHRSMLHFGYSDVMMTTGHHY